MTLGIAGLGDAGSIVAGVLYFGVFFFAGGGYFLWKVRSRRERPPVEFKLMRSAGETLRRKIERDDGNFPFYVGAYGLIPPAVLVVSLLCLVWLFKWVQLPAWLQITGFLSCAVLTAVAIKKAVRLVAVKLWQRRNNALGYMGERLVADVLCDVSRAGLHVFHDVPASAPGGPFNLDHVVVGRAGVWVIETKCRRKGRALPGREDHKVVYDGQRLRWPWGDDRSGLDQVEANARWLEECVSRLTGLSVEAHKIVTLPGWWVEAVTKRHECRVLVMNPKNLPGEILGRRNVLLSEEQVDLIARQLEELCRDVDWI